MNSQPVFLLTTVESDSHTWNLIYLQLLLEEQGLEVINLGPCVPHRVTIEAIAFNRPAAVVISSVNGHGFTQGKALMKLARETLGDECPAIVIGGQLTTSCAHLEMVRRELLVERFSGIFVGASAVDEFRDWLGRFQQTVRPCTAERRSPKLDARQQLAALP